MKKLLFLGLGSALLFTMGGIGSAHADAGPHTIPVQAALTTGVQIANVGAGQCAKCHRAHTAKAAFNLVQAQPGLCYSCHDTAGTGSMLDVQSGVQVGGTNPALRGGGFVTAAIDSGHATKDMGALDPVTLRIGTLNQNIPVLVTGAGVTAPQPVTSSHQIDGETPGTAWGNGPVGGNIALGDLATGKTLTLECGSCHDPHGNGNFRILKPMPDSSQWVTVKAVAVNDPATPIDETKDQLSPVTNINIPDQPAKIYTTDNYWKAEATGVPATLNGTVLPSGTPDGYIGNIAAWCTTCHTRYLAGSGSYKTPLKDGAGNTDPVFTYRHRSDASNKLGAANCITCHVSHGSNAKMVGAAAAVTNPGGSSTAITGDSRLLRVDNRGTCIMCHNV